VQRRPASSAPRASANRAQAPTPAAARHAVKELDLDALAASVDKLGGATRGRARKGKAPAANVPPDQANSDLSKAQAAAALDALSDGLQRRWNPNCAIAGGRDVEVHVSFTLGQGGELIGDVRAQVQGPLSPVARVAALRAQQAVYAAAPFRKLPAQFYGQPIGVNFDAKKACA
jgi:outer membrane biosynthesis protein TonB